MSVPLLLLPLLEVLQHAVHPLVTLTLHQTIGHIIQDAVSDSFKI